MQAFFKREPFLATEMIHWGKILPSIINVNASVTICGTGLVWLMIVLLSRTKFAHLKAAPHGGFWSHEPWTAKFKSLLWLSLSMNMVMAWSQLSVFNRGKKGEDGKTKAQWWEREEEMSPLEGVPDGQVFATAGLLVILDCHGLVPIIRFSFWINSYLPLLALESTPGPKGAPDGQV